MNFIANSLFAAFSGTYICSTKLVEYESPPALAAGIPVIPHSNPSGVVAAISPGNQVPLGQNNALPSMINC